MAFIGKSWKFDLLVIVEPEKSSVQEIPRLMFQKSKMRPLNATHRYIFIFYLFVFKWG